MLNLSSNSIMPLKSLFFAFFIVILGTGCKFFDFSISMEKVFWAWGLACDVEQLHEASGKWNITELYGNWLHNKTMGEFNGTTWETSVFLFEL